MQKTAIASTILVGTLLLPSVANATNYVSWSSKGAPRFTFKQDTPLTPGTEVQITLSNYSKNIQATTVDACGYKSVSAGTSASGFNNLIIGNSITTVSTLPVFDGTCNKTTGTLTPKTEGDPVPSSHYVNSSGKLFVKTEGASFFQISLANQIKKVKADKCGNLQLSWPVAKTGQTPLMWDSSATINGVSYNLEDIAQNNVEGICSGRWQINSAGLPEKIFKFFASL